MSKISKSTKQYLSRKWPLTDRPNNARHLWLGLRYGRKRALEPKRIWSIEDFDERGEA